MNKIWIDMTDMRTWKGHHTGTQRVVYEIAKRYYGQPNVGYFIFNHRQDTFHTYSFEELMDRVESVKDANQAAPRTRSVAFKQLAFGIYKQIPEDMRRKLKPHHKAAIRSLYGKSRSIIRPNAGEELPSTPEVEFGDGDTLLIMGKPWDYPAFIEKLRKEKLKNNFKLVQVIYDLIPVFYPHLFGEALFQPYTAYMFEATAISDGLLAISKSTKRDIERFCRELAVSKPDTRVIRLGDDFAKVKAIKPKTEEVKPRDFILCVGTVEVRKNIQLLYMTYKLGLSQGLNLPKLIIVGGKGWYTEDVIYQITHDPETKDKIRILRNISDGELEWLYENCRYTVYPSVYEGWGLPIAESLAREKHCIASNSSSMTEIAGELIDYFSPYNPQQLLDLIAKYSDDAVLGRKEDQIKSEYKTTTWDDTFRQVDGLVSRIVSGN